MLDSYSIGMQLSLVDKLGGGLFKVSAEYKAAQDEAAKFEISLERVNKQVDAGNKLSQSSLKMSAVFSGSIEGAAKYVQQLEKVRQVGETIGKVVKLPGGLNLGNLHLGKLDFSKGGNVGQTVKQVTDIVNMAHKLLGGKSKGKGKGKKSSNAGGLAGVLETSKKVMDIAGKLGGMFGKSTSGKGKGKKGSASGGLLGKMTNIASKVLKDGGGKKGKKSSGGGFLGKALDFAKKMAASDSGKGGGKKGKGKKSSGGGFLGKALDFAKKVMAPEDDKTSGGTKSSQKKSTAKPIAHHKAAGHHGGGHHKHHPRQHHHSQKAHHGSSHSGGMSDKSYLSVLCCKCDKSTASKDGAESGKEAKSWLDIITQLNKEFDTFTKTFKSFSETLKSIVGTIKDVLGLFGKGKSGGKGKAGKAGKAAAEGSGLIGKAVSMVKSGMEKATGFLGGGAKSVIMGGVGLLRGVIVGLGTAISTGFRLIMANPIGLALSLIVGAVYLLWKNWSTIGPKLKAVWTSISRFFMNPWNAIKKAASAAGSWIGSKLGAVWGVIKTAVGVYFELWATMFSFVKNGISGAFGFITGIVDKVWSALKNSAIGRLFGVGDAPKANGADAKADAAKAAKAALDKVTAAKLKVTKDGLKAEVELQKTKVSLDLKRKTTPPPVPGKQPPQATEKSVQLVMTHEGKKVIIGMVSDGQTKAMAAPSAGSNQFNSKRNVPRAHMGSRVTA